jgi:hypothetical protein
VLSRMDRSWSIKIYCFPDCLSYIVLVYSLRGVSDVKFFIARPLECDATKRR